MNMNETLGASRASGITFWMKYDPDKKPLRILNDTDWNYFPDQCLMFKERNNILNGYLVGFSALLRPLKEALKNGVSPENKRFIRGCSEVIFDPW